MNSSFDDWAIILTEDDFAHPEWRLPIAWSAADQTSPRPVALIGPGHLATDCTLQQSDRIVDGIRMLSTPSTCVQFTPESEDFSVDMIAPGYRWLQLNPDGSIETKVSRVEGIEFEIDLSVKGY